MSSWQEIKNNPRQATIMRERSAIIRAVREFFWQQDFMEAETPLAVKIPSQEPYLHFCKTVISDPYNTVYPFYLRTSPEFALKKMLAAGYKRLFEIGKCFRNQEQFGGTHNPEFTMIEWYRAPGTLLEIMDDVERLFRYVAQQLGKTVLAHKGCAVSVEGVWERKSIKALWQQYIQVNLDEFLETVPLVQLSKKLGLATLPDDSYEDLFFRIFLNCVEPYLGKDRPIFVYDFPARLCSLSILTSDPRYAERFELYIAGMEVANAFGELLDPKKQQINLEHDQNMRQLLKKETWPVDQDFIAALRSGAMEGGNLSTAAGIAMGIDRMVVLCTGAKDINEVIFDSTNDQLTR